MVHVVLAWIPQRRKSLLSKNIYISALLMFASELSTLHNATFKNCYVMGRWTLGTKGEQWRQHDVFAAFGLEQLAVIKEKMS